MENDTLYRDYIAVLRMLLRRATWMDKFRARHRPGHWLHEVRRTLLIHDTGTRG
jgi:hypothetical protein